MSVTNNPQHVLKEIFSKPEAQICDLSHNMSILMVSLHNKFGPFGEFGSSNSEAGLNLKYGDNEDLEKE